MYIFAVRRDNAMKTTTIRTHLLVHLFALAHALVALCFSLLNWSDEIPLTCLTILMIILVARTYNFPLDLSAVMALLFCFAGFFMGSEGGEILRLFISTGWQPLPNIITTFCVTELLGWATYLIVTKIKKNGTDTNTEAR